MSVVGERHKEMMRNMEHGMASVRMARARLAFDEDIRSEESLESLKDSLLDASVFLDKAMQLAMWIDTGECESSVQCATNGSGIGVTPWNEAWKLNDQGQLEKVGG